MKEYSYGIAPYKLENNKIFLLVSKASRLSSFGFVKGKIENDESIINCAVREFKEEVNLEIDSEQLEQYFFQKSKRKDIGIFLYDFDKINMKFLLLNKELYSLQFMELNQNLFDNFENNQKTILNQMFLYFKDLRKIQLKEKFKN